MDHLMGKVFVEYLSLLKRNRIKSKLLKAAREHERDSDSGSEPDHERAGRRSALQF